MTNINLPNFINLEPVNTLIKEALRSDSTLLNEVFSYTVAGKQLRPTLALLSYCCLKSEFRPVDTSIICVWRKKSDKTISNKMYYAATALELLHMASLLHDDIIDKATLRRHKPSTFSKFGLNTSLLAGDFLYIRAFGMCATLNKRLITEVENACITLTEGEIQETPLTVKPCSVDEALEIATKKTASLFKLACLVGADLALQEDNTTDNVLVEKMACFGEKLGIAFQIIDDILDITSSDEQLGKPIGGDIRERKPSLVNVLWLNRDSETAKAILTKDFKIADFELNSSIEEIKESGVITEAKQIADSYLQEAESILDDIINEVGETESTKALQDILKFSRDRNF